MRRRILALALTGLVLYGVAPAVVDVLGGWRDLDRVAPQWWIAVILTQVAGWGCMWALQRLALHTRDWFGVVTSQLASGALGRVVPGGAAAAAALQYRMLAQSGLERATVATGLAAGSVLLLAALAALPLLADPRPRRRADDPRRPARGGRPRARDLRRSCSRSARCSW